MSRGFTLIEAVVYMALLSMLMVGGLLATYQIIEGQSQASGHNTTEDEGGFVIRKIEWVLSNIHASDLPPTITTNNFDVPTSYGRMHLCLSGTTVYLKEGGSACGNPPVDGSLPLTSGNVKATALQFSYISGSPGDISASVTIDGEQFETLRYIQ